MLSSGEKLDLFPNFAFSTITAANTGQILALDDLLPEYGKDILSVVPDTDLSLIHIYLYLSFFRIEKYRCMAYLFYQRFRRSLHENI